MKKNIVVVGAGKGLGNAVAKRFGKSGFRVILIARNVGNLNAYKEEFEKEGIETFIYSADCEKPQTLESAFTGTFIKSESGNVTKGSIIFT